MLELALFLKLLNRELSPVFLLGVATTLLVLFNPDSIGSIGFQFSVLTTLGLLLMVPPLQEVLGYYITRGLAGLILVPLVAQLWIWPLSIAYFNQFPVHSVPLNILAMALVAPLTILGFTAGVVSLLLPPLAGWLSSLALPFVSALLSLVQWGNAMTWAQWQLPSPSELEIGAFYMGLLMLTIIIDRFKDWSIHRRALLGLLPVLIILGSLCLSSADAQSHNKVTLLPLSYRHESILIESSQPLSTRLILMPSALTYYEARALADYLKHRQIRKLNLLVLLPGESVNPSDAQSPGGPGTMLKTAFKHTQIDRLLMPTETSGTTSLLSYLSPQKQTVYPAQGIDVNAGSITIEGRANDLRVKNGAYCLIEISSTRNPSDASCGVQLAQNPRGETRLFSEKQNFPTDHFYQLVQQGKSLKIY